MFLYAETNNRTSNHVYESIGYEFIGEWQEFDLNPAVLKPTTRLRLVPYADGGTRIQGRTRRARLSLNCFHWRCPPLEDGVVHLMQFVDTLMLSRVGETQATAVPTAACSHSPSSASVSVFYGW